MAEEYDDADLSNPVVVKNPNEYDDADFSSPLPPQGPAGKPSAEYENMPWSDVAKSAATNLGPSALNAVKAISDAVIHAPEIASTIGTMGEVRRMPDVAPKPMARLARHEALTPAAIARHWVSPEESGVGNKMSDEDMKKQQITRDQFWDAVTKPYQSVANFKQALAEDPFQVLTTMSLPLTGGASGSSTLGKVAGTLGKVMNPAGLAVDAAGASLGAVGNLGKGFISVASGTPSESFSKAYQAGSSTSPELKQVFNTYARGEGNPVLFAKTISDAADKLKSDSIKDWANSKEALGLSKITEIPKGPMEEAKRAAWDRLPSREYALNTDAHETLDSIIPKINEIMNSKNTFKSVADLDKLKQELYQEAQAASNKNTSNALMELHAGVKKTINQVAPDYQQLMDQYQYMQSDINNIQKTMGTNSRTAANSAIAKSVKATKTPEGQSIIAKLGEADPRVPYMLAGATVNSPIASGYWPKGAEFIGTIGNIGAGVSHLATGNFPLAAAHLAMAAGQPILQSPSLMSSLAYRAGQVAGSPVGKAYNAGKNTLRDIQPYINGPAQTLENPLQRKSGGRVQKFDPTAKARSLIDRAHKAKASHNKSTQPLLEHDDSAIAKALEISQRHI